MYVGFTRSLTNILTEAEGAAECAWTSNYQTSPSGKFRRCKRETLFHSRSTCVMLSTLREWTCSAESEKKERKKEMYAMADDRTNVDRGRAVEAALANIEKKFGKGSIMRLGEREVSDIPAISTTSLSLDAAVGVGGVPRGRIVEIYGPESSGKTTLALHIVAEAQKAGGVAAYIDAEHAMDADYAGKLGVDIDQL